MIPQILSVLKNVNFIIKYDLNECVTRQKKTEKQSYIFKVLMMTHWEVRSQNCTIMVLLAFKLVKKKKLINVRVGEVNGTSLQYSCLENPMDGGAWKAAVHGVAKSWTWPRDFTFIFHFHALEKEMATHSSILAWRIRGTGEPVGLPSMGSHRVGHDWSNLAAVLEYLYTCMHYWRNLWNGIDMFQYKHLLSFPSGMITAQK